MVLLIALLACTSDEPYDSGSVGCGQVDQSMALEHLIDGVASPCEVDWYLATIDERGRREGPWFEDMWVAWSQDGRYFQLDDAQRLAVGAAVPDVVRGDDGRVYLFYGQGDLDVGRVVALTGSSWFRGHGVIGFGAIDAMVSDDGRTFEPLEGFEVEGIVRGMVVDPDVRRLPDGRWRMYYVGTDAYELMLPGAWEDGAAHRVFYAESDDLVSWTQVGEAVFGPNADPSVYCATATACLLASTGLDWSTSTDGGATFTFTASGDPAAFAPEFTDLGGGVVRMYFNSKYPGGALRSWLSTDAGETWIDEGERVSARTVEAVSLLQDEVGWLVYYHYWQDGIHGDTWGDTQGRSPDPAAVRFSPAR